MRAAIISVFLALFMVQAYAADVAGSSDSPLVPRFAGSEIIKYGQNSFDAYKLMTGKAEPGSFDKKTFPTLPLEGKVTRISYREPAGPSVLEVFRNYENALQKSGFQTVFLCQDEASCGGRDFAFANWGDDLYMTFGDNLGDQHYLAAKLSRPEGDAYVAVYAVRSASGGGDHDRVMVQVDVVEVKPMEQKMVVVDAARLDSEIATEGRVAIYGIRFDFDKADIKPESKPQLDEIAAFLKKSPQIRVLIVGHTDAKGSLDYNRTLSERRATAVVKALARTYGIDPARLTPVGVGMAAPVATNRTRRGPGQEPPRRDRRAALRKFREEPASLRRRRKMGRPAGGGSPRQVCRRLHIPCGPRFIAATPVRQTSTSPSGFMMAMNCSILDTRPVISKMKCSVLASMTVARKASASLSASTRWSPLPATLISASSRSIGFSWPSSCARTVRSTTRCTGTMRSSCALICSSTCGVPRVTMVMRDRCFSCSVSETVRLSML